MSILQLKIHALRNLQSVHLTFHPRFNIIEGANGSGKTSLLEAIYLLSRGYSFRTRETGPLIQHGQDALTVFAQLTSGDSISIQKRQSNSTRVKVNQTFLSRSSDLAHLFPCQVFYQDIFNIIDAGPTVRRSMLDWGLFHVKPSYHALWKNYHHALKHRNALLRQHAAKPLFIPWDAQLAQFAEALDELRRAYVDVWSTTFQTILAQLSNLECSMIYEKGWDKKQSGKSLLDLLNEQLDRDRRQQYTSSGAHQADIRLITPFATAKQTLSRGQQKIILFALKIAQAQLLDNPCIFLLDDLASELDSTHLQRVIQLLTTLNNQCIVTSINANNLTTYIEHKDRNTVHLNNGIVSRETLANA